MNGLEPESRNRVWTESALDGLRPLECGSRYAPGAWYAIQSHRLRETLARDELERQGFAAFLPLVAERRRGELRQVAAFPGYLFVRFDLARDRWRSIHSTRGVRRLFSADPETPIAVPDAAILELLRLGYDRPITAEPGPELIPPGSRVRLRSGPFIGAEGVCQWSTGDRIELLLELLGGARRVTVPRDAAEVA